MALLHLGVTQTTSSVGWSALATTAYRAGERLYSEYYSEYSDYTRKAAARSAPTFSCNVHTARIRRPPGTLWNAVEKSRRGKNASLHTALTLPCRMGNLPRENIGLQGNF